MPPILLVQVRAADFARSAHVERRQHASSLGPRVLAWHAHLPAGQLPPPLPIYTGCQVYVNHLYKVLFLRHAKTASSSLFCHFGGCKSTSANETAEEAAARKALSFELFQVCLAQA